MKMSIVVVVSINNIFKLNSVTLVANHPKEGSWP